MSVRAVTPRIPALHGHTYVHRHDCPGDCCNHDEFTDSLTTGEDIYDPDEWPDKPVRFGFTRGCHVGPARERRGPSPMDERADHRVGPDGRSARSASSTRAGAGVGASRVEAQLGGGPSTTVSCSPAPVPTPPPPARGSEPSEDMSGARPSPGAA